MSERLNRSTSMQMTNNTNVLQLPDIFRLQQMFWKTDKTFEMVKIQKCLKQQSKVSHATRYTQQNVLSVFISHVIKTKNRDHPRNRVKNLGYDRWLIYKQPHLESGLCWFSFARYLQKCVTQIYRALYGDAMFVSFWGTQPWRRWSNICHWVLLLKRNIIALEIRHIEIMLILVQALFS